MSPVYYLYQSGTHPEDDQIGHEILRNVINIMPINLNDKIDIRSAQVGIMFLKMTIGQWIAGPWLYMLSLKGLEGVLH
jgi:hypothetical protein